MHILGGIIVAVVAVAAVVDVVDDGIVARLWR
jgi:hypothetical protein